MKNRWIYLSHLLDDKLFAYGNGERIKIKKERNIKIGDTSNNSTLNLPAHFGTHIDFPYHFSNDGKKGEGYSPEYFIVENTNLVDLSNKSPLDRFITIEDFANIKGNKNTEFIIIKTGMNEYRTSKEFWNNNPGYSAKLATFFKMKFPNVRFLGIDSISISGAKYRKEGRSAHRAFLLESGILLIEDMDLSSLDINNKINKCVISPLRFKDMDGSPVTLFAELVQ